MMSPLFACQRYLASMLEAREILIVAAEQHLARYAPAELAILIRMMFRFPLLLMLNWLGLNCNRFGDKDVALLPRCWLSSQD
jgi:hypothetical protein